MISITHGYIKHDIDHTWIYIYIYIYMSMDIHIHGNPAHAGNVKGAIFPVVFVLSLPQQALHFVSGQKQNEKQT
jgi:hypothetical protein